MEDEIRKSLRQSRRGLVVKLGSAPLPMTALGGLILSDKFDNAPNFVVSNFFQYNAAGYFLLASGAILAGTFISDYLNQRRNLVEPLQEMERYESSFLQGN